jgi:hypothetical protein
VSVFGNTVFIDSYNVFLNKEQQGQGQKEQAK